MFFTIGETQYERRVFGIYRTRPAASRLAFDLLDTNKDRFDETVRRVAIVRAHNEREALKAEPEWISNPD